MSKPLATKDALHPQFSILLHVYNFVNKYKLSDIWTEPLILPAQRKHASWMYQTKLSLGTEDNRSI